MSEGDYEYGFTVGHTSSRHRPDLRWTFGNGHFNVHPAASPFHTIGPKLEGRAAAAACVSNPATVACPSSSDGTCIGGGRLRCSTSIVGTPIGSSVLGSMKACIQSCQANKACVGASMIKSSGICSLYGGTLGNLVSVSDSLQDTWLGDSSCPSLCLTASCSALPSTFSCSSDGTCIGGGRLRCGQLITGTPIGTSTLGNMNACIQACQANAACIGVSMPVIVPPLVSSVCSLFGGALGNLALTASVGVTNSWLIDSACLSAQCQSGASIGASYVITTQALPATAAPTTFVSGSYIVVGTPSHLQTTAYTTLSVGAGGFTSTISGTAIDQVLIGTASHSQVTSTTTLAAGSLAFVSTITGSSIDQVLIGTPSHIQITVSTTIGSVGFTSTSTGLLTDQILIGIATHAQISAYTTVGSTGFTSTITGASIDQVLIGVPTHAQVSLYTTVGSVAFTSTITGASIDQVIVGVPTHAQTTIYATSGSIGFTSTSVGASTDQVLIAVPTHAQNTVYTTVGNTPFTSTSVGGTTDQILIGVPTHQQTTVFTSVGTIAFTSTSIGVSIDQVIIGSPSRATTTSYTTIPSQSRGFTSTSIGAGLTDQVLIGTPSHAQTTMYTTLPAGSPAFTSTSIGPGSIDQVLVGTPSHVQVSTTLALPVGSLGYTSTNTGTDLTDLVIVALPSHVQVTVITTLAVGSSGFTSTITGVLTDQVLIGVPSHLQSTSYTTLPYNSAGFTSTSTGSLVDQVLIASPGHAQSTSYTTVPAGAVGFTSTMLGISTDQVLIGTPSHFISTSYTSLASDGLGFTSLITGSSVDQLLIGIPSHLQTTKYTTLPVGATGFTSTASAISGSTDEVVVGIASHAQTTVRLSLSAGAAAFTSTISGPTIDEVMIGVPSNYLTTITTTLPSDSSAFVSTIVASSGSIDQVLIGSPIKPQTTSSIGLSTTSFALPVASITPSSGALIGTVSDSQTLTTTIPSSIATFSALPVVTSSVSTPDLTLGLPNAVSSLTSNAVASIPAIQSGTTNILVSINGPSISQPSSLLGAPTSTTIATSSDSPLTISNSASSFATTTTVNALTTVSAEIVSEALIISDSVITVAELSTTSSIVSLAIQTPSYTSSDSLLLSVSLNGQTLVISSTTTTSSAIDAPEVGSSSSIQTEAVETSSGINTPAIIPDTIFTASSLILVPTSTVLTIAEDSTTIYPTTIIEATTFGVSVLDSMLSSSDTIASTESGSSLVEGSSSSATTTTLSSVITLAPLINTISTETEVTISAEPIAISTQSPEIASFTVISSAIPSIMVSEALPSPDGPISSFTASANLILSSTASEESIQSEELASVITQIIDSSSLQTSVISTSIPNFVSSGSDVMTSEPASSSSAVLQILESASIVSNDGSIIVDTLAILMSPSVSEVPQLSASPSISSIASTSANSATIPGTTQITLETVISTSDLESGLTSQSIIFTADSAVSPVLIPGIQTSLGTPSVEANTILSSLAVPEITTATSLITLALASDLPQSSMGSASDNNAGGSLSIHLGTDSRTSSFLDVILTTLITGTVTADVATSLPSATNEDTADSGSGNIDITTLAVDIGGSSTMLTLAIISGTVGDVLAPTTVQLSTLSVTSVIGVSTQGSALLSSLTDVVALSLATDVPVGSDSTLQIIDTSTSTPTSIDIGTVESTSITDMVPTPTTLADISKSATVAVIISQSTVDILGPDTSHVIIQTSTLSSIDLVEPTDSNIPFTDAVASLLGSSASISLDGSDVVTVGLETNSNVQVSNVIPTSESEDLSVTSIIASISPEVVPLTATITISQLTENLISGSQALPVFQSSILSSTINTEDATVTIQQSNQSPQPTDIINISEDGSIFTTAIAGDDTLIPAPSSRDTLIILTSDLNTNGLVSSVTEELPLAFSSSLLFDSAITASVLSNTLTDSVIFSVESSGTFISDPDVSDIVSSTSLDLDGTLIASLVSSSSAIFLATVTDIPDIASSDLNSVTQDDVGTATATYSTILTIITSQFTEITTSGSNTDVLQNSILNSLASSLLGSDAVIVTETTADLASVDSATSAAVDESPVSTTIDINGATAVLVNGPSGTDIVASLLSALTSSASDDISSISAFSGQFSDSESVAIGASATSNQLSINESLEPFLSLTTVISNPDLTSIITSITSEAGTPDATGISLSAELSIIETNSLLESNSVADPAGSSNMFAFPSSTATIITEATEIVDTIINFASTTQITAIVAGGSTTNVELSGSSTTSADLEIGTSDGALSNISGGIQLTTIVASILPDGEPTAPTSNAAPTPVSPTIDSVTLSTDLSIITFVSLNSLSGLSQETSSSAGSEPSLTLTTISSSGGDGILLTEITISTDVPLTTSLTETSESLSANIASIAQVDTAPSTGILDSSGIIIAGPGTESGQSDEQIATSVAIASATTSAVVGVLPTLISDTTTPTGQVSIDVDITVATSVINAETSQSTQPSEISESSNPTLASLGLTAPDQTSINEQSSVLSDVLSTTLQGLPTSTIAILSSTDGTIVAVIPATADDVFTLIEGSSTTIVSGSPVPETNGPSEVVTTLVVDSSGSTNLSLVSETTVSAVIQTGATAALPSITIDSTASSIGDTFVSSFSSADMLDTVLSDVSSIISTAAASGAATQGIISGTNVLSPTASLIDGSSISPPASIAQNLQTSIFIAVSQGESGFVSTIPGLSTDVVIIGVESDSPLPSSVSDAAGALSASTQIGSDVISTPVNSPSHPHSPPSDFPGYLSTTLQSLSDSVPVITGSEPVSPTALDGTAAVTLSNELSVDNSAASVQILLSTNSEDSAVDSTAFLTSSISFCIPVTTTVYVTVTIT